MGLKELHFVFFLVKNHHFAWWNLDTSKHFAEARGDGDLLGLGGAAGAAQGIPVQAADGLPSKNWILITQNTDILN